jgi:hypothetical protein
MEVNKGTVSPGQHQGYMLQSPAEQSSLRRGPEKEGEPHFLALGHSLEGMGTWGNVPEGREAS